MALVADSNTSYNIKYSNVVKSNMTSDLRIHTIAYKEHMLN